MSRSEGRHDPRDAGVSRSRRDSHASRGPRLDVPKDTRRLVLRPRFEDDTFGRFAERFARFMGTASFLLYMSGFVVVWILWNWLAPAASAWDAYPFIFLTLMLSLQASYAAPLILLAQNRQEDRDRVVAEQDRLANSRAHADMEFLAREMASLRMALGEVATRDYVRSELRSLLGDLEEQLDGQLEGLVDRRLGDRRASQKGGSSGSAPGGTPSSTAEGETSRAGT